MSHPTHLAFADESGDTGMKRINPTFPLLSFATCVFEASEYAQVVVPAVRDLKQRYFGNRQVTLHERDIRRNTGAYVALGGPERRRAFEAELVEFVEAAPFVVIAIVVHKLRLRAQYPKPDDPYSLCLRFAFERLRMHVNAEAGRGHVARIIAEGRNPVADRQLRTAFESFRTGDYLGAGMENVELDFATKQDGHPGMEIADLIANPIARHVLGLPEALIPFSVIDAKLRRNQWGSPDGWGLKVFP